MATPPDLSSLSSIPEANASAGQNLLAGQQNKIDTFNQGVSSFYNDPKNNLTAIASNIGNQIGLPTLQSNANQINTQVANLPFTYKDATRGFDVNQNQLDRIIGQKTYELTPGQTTANNALSAGENQFGLLTSQAQQDIANRGLPFQMAQTSMLDQMARQSTMFTTANQQELDGLIAKVNAGVTLSEGEANRANQLAIAEEGYQNALKVAQAQNQYFSVFPGGSIYNAQGNNGIGSMTSSSGGYKAPGA